MKNPIALLLLAGIILYRYSLSYLLGRQCRFLPTCSEYSYEAIKKYGVLKGTKLAIIRISKCHPWCQKSGIDNVP